MTTTRHTDNWQFNQFQRETQQGLREIQSSPILGGRLVGPFDLTTALTSIGNGNGAVPITNTEGAGIKVVANGGSIQAGTVSGTTTARFYIF